MRRPRNVLLLQGPSSLFFAKLGKALRRRGAKVWRVTFCPGDALYWHRRCGKKVPFRGRAEDWPGFLIRLVNAREITDIVCLGDARWQHRAAIDALGASVQVHVIEHGYLRPGWLTVEQGGIGPNSPLPRNRAEILVQADGLNDLAAPEFSASFFEYAALDIGYHLANLAAAWWRYPHYRRHALDHPIREWAGWIGRFARAGSTRRRDAQAQENLAETPFFLVPLQLETDFQIRLHGPDGGQVPFVMRLIKSFAQDAAPTDHLLFKMHPLDNGWTPWAETIRDAAQKAGIAGRCHFIETGDLDALLGRTRGVLVVNSTVGLQAIAKGVPVRMSGDAIYRINGLVDGRSLDEFWTSPQPPAPDLAEAFLRVLKHRAMLPGAFDGSGASVGASALADRIVGAGVP